MTIASPTRRSSFDEIAFILWLGTLCLYLLSSAAILDNPDGRSAYSITQGLLLRGTLAIPESQRLDEMFEKTGRDGEVYSKYGLVQPLAQAPLFLIGRALAPTHEPYASQHAVALLNAFTTATTLVVLRSLAYALFGSARIALAIALIYGTATMAWLYATLTYSEPLLTLILLLACRLLLAVEQDGGRWTVDGNSLLRPAPVLNTSTSPAIMAGFAGVLAGLMILTKYPAAIYMPVLLWYVWQISRGSRRTFAAFVAPMGLGVLALAGYNLWRYGNILNTGYHIQELTRLPRPPWYGLYTLFFSLGKSIFIYAPPLLPAAFALPQLVRRTPLFGRFVVALIICSLLFYGIVRPWSGAWSPGPRYQLPVLPLALLALGCLFERRHMPGTWKQLALIGCVAAGVLVQIPLVTTSYNDTLVVLQVITGGQYAWGFWFFDPDYMPLLWQSRLLASALLRIVGRQSLFSGPLPFSVDRPGQPVDQLACWFANLPAGSGWGIGAIVLALITGVCFAWLLRYTLIVPRSVAPLQTREASHATMDVRSS